MSSQRIGPCSIDSTSSHSDGGEYEQNGMLRFLPSHRNFSGLYSFMLKPVYPVPFAAQVTEAGGYGTDSICTSSRLVSADGRNSFRWPDNSVQHEKSSEGFSEFGSTLARSLCAEGVKCGLCERWLAQKSPWSSHRMVRSGDLPASSVLSCGHVYHADCLEQTIPETQKHDPPCPSCGGALKIPSVSDFEQSAPVNGQEMISAFGGKFPRFKIATDDDSPSSSENQNYIHSAHVTDVSGRKWHMQKPGHDKKSFLSRTLSRRHFFEGKTHKQLSAIELGLESGGSSMHVYHDNRLTHHLPSG